MSADELRHAAETLRRLASREELEMLGDWLPNDITSYACDGGWICSEDERVAAYISTVRPQVGMALADALDAMADNGYLEADPECSAMLTIARLVNGGAS